VRERERERERERADLKDWYEKTDTRNRKRHAETRRNTETHLPHVGELRNLLLKKDLEVLYQKILLEFQVVMVVARYTGNTH
jgi:tRNA/tmRNA/rRNA uracil-C5-methylase (TrmA/RlmC/RlmD family)